MNAITGMVLKEPSLVSGRALSAAGEAPNAVVPLKPSVAMLAAGTRAGGVSVEVAWKIYLAMIKAAD